LVQLTTDDRVAANGVGRMRLPFIQQAHTFANAYKDQLMLSNDALAKINRMMLDFLELDKLLERLRVFQEGLDDTVLLIGSNCYKESLLVKDLAEIAVKRGVPGMEHVLKELSQYWESTGGKKKDNGTDTPNPDPAPGNAPA
jgi:hypothetical protein